MIGGPPMQMFPGNGQMFPVSPPQFPTGPPPYRQPAAPPAGWSPAAGAPQAQIPLPPQQVPAPPALAQAPVPQPKYRGLRGTDEPAEASVAPPRPALAMPSPAQLGLTMTQPVLPAAAGESLDWNAALQQVNHLGATNFNLVKLSPDSYQVSLMLPTGEKGLSQQIEAMAHSQAEAVRLALDRAERWAALHR
jgi:hypothetical protein